VSGFDGTFVPTHRLLGAPGRSIQTVLAEFDFSRPALALMCVGAALGAIERTMAYAKEREVFGQPISRYQGVSFPLAEHVTVLEGIRWLSYRALALRDAGMPHTTEAAMVKWWAPRAAVEAISDCVITHGHVGYSMEMPFMQLLNDVAGLQIGDGTPQIQKLIIARHMFGRAFSG
jgi:cyclohexanecarboxyl-CoA dehydrogenase